ncbi:MAG TPA: sulfotransferase [Caulobacteraceae bacterium]|jgi:tetratricopeptide (TPR) repeat protein
MTDKTDTDRLAEIARLATVDLGSASSLAEQALAEGVAAPWLYGLVGLALKSKGRFEEAILAFGKALEHETENASLMTKVGLCLLELGRRQEAAQVLGVAVKLDPQSPEASFAYGWAAENLGALDSAKSAWERATRLDPDRADALAGLSGLAARRRDWQEARRLGERAAALDPDLTDAPMNLARVEVGLGDFDAAERRLKALIARPNLKPQVRANARILLGDVFDANERYDEAFASYSEGKSDFRAQHAERFRNSERPSSIEIVRAMSAEFIETPEAAWRLPEWPLTHGPARGHAFLIGFPRSGTTLIEQVIATHPDMEALGERPVMIDAETEFLTRAGGIARLADTMSDLLEPYRNAYWLRAREFGVIPTGKVFVDKHPFSTMRLPLLSKVFPEAKIIFALRDPRDVVLSCFRRSFNINANTFQFTELASTAELYDVMMTAGELYLSRLPLQVHRLRYEALVADFEAEGRALCEFLGVEWTEDLKEFATTQRAIATPSSTQVRRGLYEEGVGQWRRYARFLEPVMPRLAPWIEKFGYEA